VIKCCACGKEFEDVWMTEDIEPGMWLCEGCLNEKYGFSTEVIEDEVN
jgi:hypothetical protein